jgi:hypothetical protein
LVDIMLDSGVDVFSLERVIGKTGEFNRNAGKILEHHLVKDYIAKKSKGKKPAILFFKPSYKIDLICEGRGYLKLGNNAGLNRLFEDKIAFFRLCQKNSWPVPEGTVAKVKEFDFSSLGERFGLPFVVQFGRGWAGSTTFFIKNKDDWDFLLNQWSERVVKVSEKISGRTVVNNACIFKGQVLVTLPAVQLPFLEGLNGDSTATFGRQWPSGLSKKQTDEVEKLTHSIGLEMMKFGYGGWFGLDFLVDERNGEIYVSENNARLTASATFYTQTEIALGKTLPLLFYHVSQFLGNNSKIDWKPLDIQASQFVYRNFTSEKKTVIKAPISGIYNRECEFLRKGSGSLDLRSLNEVFWSCPSVGESISKEVEVFTMETKSKILNKSGQYATWFAKFVEKTTDKIVLK